MGLTGRINFRKSWLGDVILEVEEDIKPLLGRRPKRRWRRAKLIDLAQPELGPLMRLRPASSPTRQRISAVAAENTA
jgi:hypothetical protein